MTKMLGKKFTLLLLGLCVGGSLVSEASSASLTTGSFAEDNNPEVIGGGNPFGRLKETIVDCTRQAGKAMNDFIKPQVEYFKLMQRFNKWQGSYNNLLAKTGSEGYLKSNELVRRTFGQVDNELYLEMEARAERRRQLASELGLAEEAQQEVEIENTDYLYEVLKRLVDRLEAINELVVTQPEGAEVVQKESGRLSEEAIERVKRIAVLSARDFLAVELVQVSRMAALNAFAAYLASSPPAHDSPLGAITPLVMLLGNPHATIASSYVTSLQFRHVIGWLDAVNPVPNLLSSVFGRITHNNHQHNHSCNKRHKPH